MTLVLETWLLIAATFSPVILLVIAACWTESR